MDLKNNTVVAHLKLHRGFYLLLPIILLLIVGLIHFVYYLTGRPPTDGPGVLIVYGYNMIACVMAYIMTVFVKSHSTLNRPSMMGDVIEPDEPDGHAVITDWRELLISRAYTMMLLALFLRYITGIPIFTN